ncbi:MAG: fimbria major subunit [Muribaculaceae bacterium]|nr:fimbria major subunit [Muribaculaceae bacterium]
MKKLIYTLPLLLALGACSNDDVTAPDPTPTPQSEGYYLTMNLTVPVDMKSTKSTTVSGGGSSDGTLEGVENEWTIETVDLYLLKSGDKSVLKSYKGITNAGDNKVEKKDAASGMDATYHVEYKLDDVDAFATAVAGNTICMVVICNPDQYASGLDLSSMDQKFTGIIQEFGTDRKGKKMPMGSIAYSSDIEDFKDITGEDPEKKLGVRSKFAPEKGKLVYNLSKGGNAVSVERAYARLDLAIADKYDLYDGIQSDENKSGIQLAMYSAQVINANTKTGTEGSYVLRHRNEGTLTSAGSTIKPFGNEGHGSDNVYTWVADGTWSGNSKNAALLSNGTADEITTIKTYATNEYQNTTYYSWCYVPENTIPSTDLMSPDNLKTNATGVTFNFEILQKDSESEVVTYETPADKLPTYVQADYENGKITHLYITLPKTGKTQTFEPIAEEGANKGKIFLTYTGFITHNQESNGIAPMHYGVVRNNVYQMKVNKIENLPNGTDAEYYLQLDINVLQWNRRVVGFDF